MGPAAGISFAVLRINRATLRLDPRVGPPLARLRPPASRLPRRRRRRRRRRRGRRDGRRLRRRRRRHANSPSSASASTLVRNSRDTARELLRRVDINLSRASAGSPLVLFPLGPTRARVKKRTGGRETSAKRARARAQASTRVTVLIFCRPRFATHIRAVTAATLLPESFGVQGGRRDKTRERATDSSSSSTTKKWILGVHVVSTVCSGNGVCQPFIHELSTTTR